MLKQCLVFTLFMVSAHASGVFDDAEEGMEDARTFITSGGQTFLALNTTQLLLYSVLLGAALFAALAIASLFTTPSQESYGSTRYGQEPVYNEYDEHYYRQKRFAYPRDNDVASKLYQLEQAFKKYEVAEAECRTYVSCEASQVHRHEENGPLAKIVYEILAKSKPYKVFDDKMKSYTQAFEYGSSSHKAGRAYPCEPLRKKCVELQGKKDF